MGPEAGWFLIKPCSDEQSKQPINNLRQMNTGEAPVGRKARDSEFHVGGESAGAPLPQPPRLPRTVHI